MRIRILFIILLYLVAFAISIKSFREPDLWWQIRTGEWIMEHKEVPRQDVFSYTMDGSPWINIKWGFEVIAAIVAGLFGPESVFILQGIVNCLIVFFLFRIAGLYLRQKHGEPINIHSSSYLISAALAFILLFVAVDYRMIGRPEMISHLFTLVFIYLLQKDFLHPEKKIFLLIPLQLLWANLHEAFGIGLVILVIYTVSEWIHHFSSGSERKKAWRLTLITLASTAAVVINPNGVELLTRPFNIMSQVYENKYTTELFDITTSDWWKKEAYLALIIAVTAIMYILILKWRVKDKQKGLKKLVNRLNQPVLIVILACFYLGVTAYRNLIFLSLVSFPLFFAGLYLLLDKWKVTSRIKPVTGGSFAILLMIAAYASVVSNKFYEWTNSRDRFGLEVLSVNNPVGAASYIERHQLKNKTCFSDYLTSSYLLWKLQPEFKTYIDLRDLDVFPPEFFSDFLRDINSPYDYFRLDSVRNFQYAVVFRPQFDALHSYLYNDSIYALKYVDAVAAVYEKTDSFSRGDIFSPCPQQPPGLFATAVNQILNPFYKPYDYSLVETDYIAANYYLSVGRTDLARNRAKQLIDLNSYKGYELLAQLDYRMSKMAGSDSSKQSLIQNSETNFTLALKQKPDYAPAWLGLGAVHYEQRNFTAAIKDFGRCLEEDPNNYQAHLSIAQCYSELLGLKPSKKDEYRNKLVHHFKKANSISPGNPMVIANLGFVYFQMNDCDNAVKYLLQVTNDKRLGEAERTTAKNCLSQCGY